MARNLASVQRIVDIGPIEGADAIERVTVLGWNCVTRKGEFKLNDLVVYCEIDSLLPRAPWCEFLFKPGRDDAATNYRLKTVKLRGQVSQGLVLPLSILEGKKFESDTRENPIYEFNEGMDVTSLLGIVKYEPNIPANLAGVVKGSFPSFIPKTDETRIQAAPKLIDEFKGKLVYITTKMDGSSCTFYWNRGEFGVCSRNLELKEDENNTLWKLAKMYNIKEKLEKLDRNIGIQGEVCGEGIQKNPIGIKGHDFFVFNVYDIDTGRYLDHPRFIEVVDTLELKSVPLDYVGPFKEEWDKETILKMAEGKYPGTNNHREGIVIRAVTEFKSEALKGRSSFKCISNSYLLKGGE
jgi:RNA ligase (TIGR02306 family)